MVRIVVTGMGIITAIGQSVEANRLSLMQEKSGIGKAAHFSSRYIDLMPFAEIPFSVQNLAAKLAVPESGVTRTDLIALYALRDAIADARIADRDLRASSTAFISGSTVGGMCLTDEMYADANTLDGKGSDFVRSYSNSAHTTFLQRQYSFGGVINTFNTACSSSANAIMYGARLIQNGLAKRVIVGGVDSLSKFTVNGFNSLMILSPHPCKPFDLNRKGLNLGEGAAFLVLETEADAQDKRSRGKF